jgi:long-chain acyl-CoA synthetase
LLQLAGGKCPKLKVLVSMDPLEYQGRQALTAWAKEKGVQLIELTERALSNLS